MGGGIAGMSAAHELIERGFDVEIVEKNESYIGGKARSELATVGSFNNIPGEHGFRFFPGFYRHITHTMSRIPFGSGYVSDNLVSTDIILFARNGADPLKAVAHFPLTTGQVNILFQTVNGGAASTGLTNTEVNAFKNKIFQLLTTSNSRFNDEYEQTGWWYFVDADKYSTTYQNLLANGLTKSLVAAQAETMSTKVGGSIFLQLIYNMADPTLRADRILNGPTNDQFLTPWYNHLISAGVVFHKNHEVTKLNLVNDQIVNIQIRDHTTNTDHLATGDYYLMAMPVEKANNLLTSNFKSLDPTLHFISDLAKDVAWMNGVQFYLNQDIPISPGHVIHVNSEYAITSISQVQYWLPGFDVSVLTGGLVKGIISIDISDWDTMYNGFPARNCTETQLIQFIYEQLYNSLIIGGVPVLPVNMSSVVVGYHIGSSIQFTPGGITNNEPLLVNKVNSWSKMPKSWSRIKNLFIAGDYTRTNTGLATMEAANESARRAVNCIIDASGTGKPYAKVWKLHSWKMTMPYKWFDKRRYDKGIPYSMHYPWWLHVIAFFWAIVCFFSWIFKYLFTLLFGPI